MKKMMMAAVCVAGISLASVAIAAPIYFELGESTGNATIYYDINGITAPTFDFVGTSTDLNAMQYDFSGFTAGEYTLSVSVTDLWASSDTDATSREVTIGNLNVTSQPFTLNALTNPGNSGTPGTEGYMEWAIDLVNYTGKITYDFGLTGDYTNAGFTYDGNFYAYSFLDAFFSGNQTADGVMDGTLGWDSLRIELNKVPDAVPEPATMLLFSVGLAGLVGYNRKRSMK